MSSVAAIVVVLLAEVAVRALHGSVQEPVVWYDAKAQVKVEQMNRLRRQRERADFVFAGTSMVFRGINPQVFDEAGHEETISYNAALLAGVPPVMERWLLEEVQPRLRPRVVVYGLSSVDFQGGRYKRPVRSYERALATRRGFMASLERFGARTMKLVRLRAMLRDPKVWKDPPESLPRKEGPVERSRKTIHEHGYEPKTWEERGRDEFIRMRDQVLGDFAISERGTKSLVRTIQTLQSRGIEVVLVSMPVPEGYVGAHPRGGADFEAAERHMRAVADAVDVTLIDMSESMKESAFIDFTHLHARGAERFTIKLRRNLRALGY